MIGIIGAMEDEIVTLKKKMTNTTEKTHGVRTFYVGKINNKDVVLVKAGIGKVNAALTTTLLLENFDLKFVINIGVAGGLKPAKPSDLVVSRYVAYHDVDVTSFGSKYKHGQIPGEDLVFSADKELIDIAKEVLDNSNINHRIGNIVSGDQFVTSLETIKPIQKHISDIVAVEMEAAAIAHISKLYNKPFIILRSISDLIDSDEQADHYEQFLESACQNATYLVINTIDLYYKRN